jgi:hypothetical protein
MSQQPASASQAADERFSAQTQEQLQSDPGAPFSQ